MVAVGALAGLGETLLAQRLPRRLEVSAGLDERALAVHHPRAGEVAELLDERRRDLCRAHWASSPPSAGASGCSGASATATAAVSPSGAVSASSAASAAGRGLLRFGRRLGGAHLLGGHLRLPRLDRARDHADDQAAGADGVVVARDDVVGVVRVAVRVDERDHRQPEAAGLTHGELLLAEVDDEDGVRHRLHVGNAAEIDLELLELGHHGDALLRRQQLELPLVAQAPQLVQAGDALGDGAPVGEQAAQPAMVHVRHADALRFVGDGVLALLLRADEQDRAFPLGDVPRERGRLLGQLERLLEIDDVDAAPLREDEAAHLWVPAARLVAEVNSGLQQLSHGDDGH